MWLLFLCNNWLFLFNLDRSIWDFIFNFLFMLLEMIFFFLLSCLIICRLLLFFYISLFLLFNFRFYGSIISYKEIFNDRIWIKSIHTLLMSSILKDTQFREWSDSHHSAKLIIWSITINLIDFDIPLTFCKYFIDDIF